MFVPGEADDTAQRARRPALRPVAALAIAVAGPPLPASGGGRERPAAALRAG
jgi:hypothetical protein